MPKLNYLEVIFCRALWVDSVIFVITFLIFVGYATISVVARHLLRFELVDSSDRNEFMGVRMPAARITTNSTIVVIRNVIHNVPTAQETL